MVLVSIAGKVYNIFCELSINVFYNNQTKNTSIYVWNNYDTYYKNLRSVSCTFGVFWKKHFSILETYYIIGTVYIFVSNKNRDKNDMGFHSLHFCEYYIHYL